MVNEPNGPEENMEGRHRRLYEENLVFNIMLATAYYVKDIMEENPELDDDDIYDFVEESYEDIIDETLEEFQRKGGPEGDPGFWEGQDPGDPTLGIEPENGPDDTPNCPK